MDDRLHSLHRILDDLGFLHFDCVDDVLNVRVDNLLRDFRYLDDLFLRLNERVPQRPFQRVK